MKHASWLVNTVQKISILSVLMMIGNVFAMNEQPSLPLSGNEYARQFPLMTAKLAHWKYDNSNVAIRKQIDEKIADQKNECLSIIFNLVTKSPNDYQKITLAKLFNGNKSVDGFLKLQLKDAWEQYLWARDIDEGRTSEYFRNYIAKDVRNIITIDFLLQNFHEIKILDNRIEYDNGYPCVNHDDLKAIAIMNERSKRIGVDKLFSFKRASYRHYDPYTVKNFLHKFKNREALLCWYILFIVSFGTIWLSRIIELPCKKTLTASDIEWNTQVPIYNEWLKQQWLELENEKPEFYQIIKSSLIRDGYKRLIEEHYEGFEGLKINAPFFGIPAIIYFCATFREDMRVHNHYRQGSILKKLGFSSITGLVGGCLGGFVGGLILMGLSYLRSDDFPLGFMGVFLGVTASFLSLAFYHNAKDMKKGHYAYVKVQDISELLKKHDIGELIIE